MKEFGHGNLLKPQVFTLEEEIEAIQNTMALDYVHGHRSILQEAVSKLGDCKPWIRGHLEYLVSLTDEELAAEEDKSKPKSLLMTAIMLTGECNAACQVCCTNRKKKENELQWEEIKSIINQTHALGSRTIYIAGEGEPLLDRSFLKVVDYVKEVGMDMLVFTNGTLFSDEALAQKRFGMSCEELVERLAEAPVYIYHKFWTTTHELNRKLMGLKPYQEYQYADYTMDNGTSIQIPKGLKLLLEKLPRERVGIEAYVEKRTADEVRKVIIPFVEETGVKSYIEPLIHSGSNFANFQYDPTPEQIAAVQHYLVRQGCTRVAYMFAVMNDGHATPGVAILPSLLKHQEGYEQLNVRAAGGIVDLYGLRHSHPFLVRSRYMLEGCLCERFNLEMLDRLSGAG